MIDQNEMLNRIARLLEDQALLIKPFLTVDEAAVYLNQSTSNIYKLTSSGKIPHVKKGGRVYFDREKLNEWVLTEDSKDSQELRQLAKSVFNQKR
jgi:excisionase family DNA binding protein